MANKPSKVASFPQDKPVKAAPKTAPSGKSPGGKSVPATSAKTPTNESEKKEAKLSLKIKTNEYESTLSHSGAKSFNNGDSVAHLLAGKEVLDILVVAEKLTGETIGDKYDHLNVGMQRMNLGNKIRAFIKKNPDKIGEFKKLIG